MTEMRYFYICDIIKNVEVQVKWHPRQNNIGDYASNTMAQNITNRSDRYTYMQLTHHKCPQGLQIPVLWEGVLELYP